MGCGVRSEPLPQASESARQYSSHPQRIRWGLFGETGNFLITDACCRSSYQAYTRESIGGLPLDDRLHFSQTRWPIDRPRSQLPVRQPRATGSYLQRGRKIDRPPPTAPRLRARVGERKIGEVGSSLRGTATQTTTTPRKRKRVSRCFAGKATRYHRPSVRHSVRSVQGQHAKAHDASSSGVILASSALNSSFTRAAS